MIFEDLHWIDPTSLEFLNRLWKLIVDLPVLVLATYRPEFSPGWVGVPHVTLLALSRLGQREGTSLINVIAGSRPLSPSSVDQILTRSDGIPLFIEELTKAILEAPTRESAIPNTLHALLMARLDRLGPAKEVAQIGAAIGRAFSDELVSLIVSKPSEQIRSALDRLVVAGLLFQQGVPPEVTYVFKHALVQDAAYGTLLREPRRKLHARIAAVLANRFPDVVESQPELLARHYSEAGLGEKAGSWWGKAGYRSLARSALVEASEQLTRALAETGALPSTTARRRDLLNLQLGLVNALMHTSGYASPDAKASLVKARLLIEDMEAHGEAPEDPLLLFSVLYGFWVANHTAFNGDVVRDLADQFLGFAEKQRAAVPLMIAHRVMGTSLLVTGEFGQGRAHFDESIALYEPAKHRPLAARFGQDNRVASLSYRSLALWGLGFPQDSLADIKQLLDDAREIGQAATSMYALFYASLILTLHGAYATASTRADELVALADKSGSLIWKASGTAVRGTIFALTGRSSEAVHTITSGLESFRSVGGTLFRPFFLSYIAYAHAQLGQLDDAWRCIGEAMAAVQSTKESWYVADVNRVAGEVALRSPNRAVAKAEAHFERALSISRAQQARTLELRAAICTARLWLDLGKRQQASDLLAPIYGSFTEPLETPDFRTAHALLKELGPE
jgi:predicted ATPase